MSEKLHLQIPKPCHEDWNKMNPDEKGRFCDSCQKAVIDFTGMSDTQLVAFFKKPSVGSVCGRFYNDQLDRSLAMPGKRMPWLKYFLQLFVPAFLLSCRAKAQGEPIIMGKPATVVDTSNTSKDKNGNSVLSSNQAKISGRVVDEQGVGIPGAAVIIKGTRYGVSADSHGNFVIEPFVKNPSITLVFTSIGFAEKEMRFDLKSLENNYKVVLIQMEYVMAGEVVVARKNSRKSKKNN